MCVCVCVCVCVACVLSQCLVKELPKEYYIMNDSQRPLTYCCAMNVTAQCTRVHIQYRDLSLCTLTMGVCAYVFHIHHV